MFGIGFFEFAVIIIVAILFLGPDKLPQAVVKIVKTFKTFSKSINDAKAAIEEEINIQELKEDSKKYRALLERNTVAIKKSLSFEELEALQEVNSTIEELKNETANSSAEDKNAATLADKTPTQLPDKAPKSAPETDEKTTKPSQTKLPKKELK